MVGSPSSQVIYFEMSERLLQKVVDCCEPIKKLIIFFIRSLECMMDKDRTHFIRDLVHSHVS